MALTREDEKRIREIVREEMARSSRRIVSQLVEEMINDSWSVSQTLGTNHLNVTGKVMTTKKLRTERAKANKEQMAKPTF